MACNKLMIVSMCVVACGSLLTSTVRADRLPIRSEELIDQSDLIVSGVIEGVKAGDANSSLSTAHVHVALPAFKGSVVGNSVYVQFEASKSQKSERLAQLVVGGEYLLFLKASVSGYKLVDPFDGVIEKRAMSPDVEKAIRAGIQSDSDMKQVIEKVQLDIRAESAQVEDGETVSLVLTVKNGSGSDFNIPARIVDDTGVLVLQGWTRMILETIKGGKVIDKAYIGGSPCKRGVVLAVPPGGTQTWKFKFMWGEYGRKIGQYRLTWKCGKVMSNTIDYEVTPRALK